MPYFPLFLGKEVVRNRFNTAHKNPGYPTGVLLYRRSLVPTGGMIFKSNTAHKNRLTAPLNGSLLLYALSKGENWMNLGFSMIKNRKKWFESNT